MAEYATLAIKVDSKGVVKATHSLDKLDKQGLKTEKTTKKLGASAKLLGVAFVALATSALAANLLAVNREFESLRTSLVTTTGSVEDANIAFEGIKEFAATTPFAVAEVTNAFIKLGNLGLAPSERALNSYGNTAGAMGKSLNQMIEAVADATTGEFERLKEFGIKTKTEGDRISLTFRGVTTQIGKNAGEIQNFLINLGETEFAGGMALQAATLNGAISNLGDSWDSFLDNLLSNENSSKVTSAVKFVSEAIDSISNKLDDSAENALRKRAAGILESNYVLENLIKELESDTSLISPSDDYINRQKERLAASKKELNGLNDQIGALATKSKKSFDEIAESLNKVSSDKASASALKDHYEELVKASDKFNTSLRTPREIYNEEIAVLKELRATRIEGSNAALISQETYNRGLIAAKETLDASLAKGTTELAKSKEELDNLDDSLNTTADNFDALTSAVDGWGASFADAMMSSSGSFTDFAENMINQLQRIALQQASQPIFDAFGGFLQTGISSLLGSFGTGGTSAGQSANFGTSMAGPSFAGGGTTGSGSRSGGVDGQGGFPAVLHPNETVIDHSRGQSSGGSINIAVNVDASGSSAEGDSKGLDLGKAIGIAIRSVLIEEKRNGGLLA